MSEQLKESLSAVMDDEADAFELRRVLDEADADEALREQWHRYHLVRDVMRNDGSASAAVDLRKRMWEELLRHPDDHERADDANATLVLKEHPTGPQTARNRTWFGRLTAGGVAAAVAAMVVINGGVFDDDTDNPALATIDSSASALVSAQNAMAAGGKLTPVLNQQITPSDQLRQHALILRHIQQKAMNQPGVTSFVKMATYRTAAAPADVADTRVNSSRSHP